MYFAPYLLIIGVPILFSHFFAPFGIILGPGSYERWKVLFAFLAVLLGILELIIVKPKILLSHCKQYGRYYLPFLVFPLVPLFLYGIPWEVFFLGSREKHHGYLFVLVLLGAFLIFSLAGDRKKLLRASVMTATFIALIAILEWMGWFRFVPTGSVTVWGSDRTIATLGNPNYLAGYLLLHIPLVFGLFQLHYRIFLSGLIFLAILSTGSLIALLMIPAIGIWLMIRSQKHAYLMTFFLVVFVGIFLLCIPRDKLLSLQSRGVLMQETVQKGFSSPFALLVGHGADQLVVDFDQFRSDRVDQYFPRASRIDSSHNILIDTVYQYGLILTIFLLYLILRHFSKLKRYEKIAVVSIFGFFSLNPYIISPLLVLCLLLSHSSSVNPQCSKSK